MTVLTLTATARHTDIECSWDLTGTQFATVTSMVLTYTDLGTNQWYNQSVICDGPVAYTEMITGLESNTDFKVYLTVYGKKANNDTLIVISSVEFVTTTTPPTPPEITLLAGKTFLQVLFWASSANKTPYDFANSDIDGFVVACNDLSANSTANESQENTTPSARQFSISDVKTYTFTDISGNQYTYKYVLMPDLQENHLHEVAVTYYTDYGLGSISNTLQLSTSSETQTFAAYALNDVDVNHFVGVNPSLTITWRDPVAVSTDVYADLPSKPKTIERQYQDASENWIFDVSYNLDQSIDVTQSFLVGQYQGDGSGNFAYNADTTGLVAGTLYRYIITMRYTADTVDVTSTTNSVVALKKPTLDMSANALILDVTTGNFSMDASFSTVVTDAGGFAESEFNNNGDAYFILRYSLDGGAMWSSKAITVSNGSLSCDPIVRGADNQMEIQFEIKARPMHSTNYISSYFDTGSQADDFGDATSGTLNGNYNTTLPGAVANFAYTNVDNSSNAVGTITLTWSEYDSSANNSYSDPSYVFFRILATKADSTTLIAFLAADFTNINTYITGHDYSDTYNVSDGICSYTFDTNTHAFFVLGGDYSFTIERAYINLNTIASSPAGQAGGSNSEMLFGPIAGTGYSSLRLFENPPAPLVTAYEYQINNNALVFNIAYGAGTYGFTHGETYFRVTLTDASGAEVYDASNNIQASIAYYLSMANIGAVGDSFTLRVRAYVFTDYLSNGTDDNFYSSEVTKTFVKEGPVPPSDSVVSYKDTNQQNQDGTDMLIEWSEVTNAAATALNVPIYYRLEVLDETTETTTTIFLLPPDLLDASGNIDASNVELMFGSAGLPANYARYDNTNDPVFSYIYTNCTLGRDYSYTITARYYAPDFNKYVLGESEQTARALRAFGAIPVPIAHIDVESHGVFFNFDMSYHPTNNSGVANSDIVFEYSKVNSLATNEVVSGTQYDLSANENQVAVSIFNPIQKGDVILVGFRTYYETYVASNAVSMVKNYSTLVSNPESVNPVKFTYSPQIKSIHISYVGGECLIAVTHEVNGEIPSEFVGVTHSADVANTLTLATYYDEEAASDAVDVADKIDDYTYTLTVPTVKVNGLVFANITLHNSNGLAVAQVSNNTGLVTGTYVLDRTQLTSHIFVLQA
jgi:hypothetical protein